MDQPSRKQCVGVLLGLAALTAIELAVVYVVEVSNTLLIAALGTLVATKVALVAMAFLHLRADRPILRARVLVPMSMPALFALVLVAREIWSAVP